MDWIQYPLPDADVRLLPGWLTAAEAGTLHARLQHDVAWSVHRIRLFGREVDSPRLSCWIGDPGAGYRYSGVRFDPHPWPPVLDQLRRRLEAELRTRFDSVLANRYRDGRDAMGWHSDDEPELGPAPSIASVSLGATRRFLLRQRADHTRKLTLELPPGSLLLMAGPTQRYWQHALPRTARPVGERINLTFRNVGNVAAR